MCLLGVFGEISHDKRKMDVSPRLQSRLVTVFVVRVEFGGGGGGDQFPAKL